MKILCILLIILSSSISLAASSSKKCLYALDVDSSIIEGTGFKYTKKTGVAGKFLKFSVNSKEQRKEIKELLNGLVVTVDLMSVDSGNGVRDNNLREAFFSMLKNNSEAKVTVKSVKENEIAAELTVNGVTKPISFTYKIENDKIEAKGHFDILDFAMTGAFTALKKRCGSLHTGADGKSKTWSTFDLRVESKVIKSCS